MQYLRDGHVPDGMFLARPNDKSQLTLLSDRRKSPTYHFPRRGSLAFCEMGYGIGTGGYFEVPCGPCIGPHVAHTRGEPCTASHTSPDVNIIHHSG